MKRDMTYLLNPTSPLDLHGKHDLVIVSPQIVGGRDCIRLTECTNVRVIGGICGKPVGTSADTEDTEGHAVILDKCVDCHVVGVMGYDCGGDAFNLYNSKQCSVEWCVVSGVLPAKACAAIIDGPNGSRNLIANLDTGQSPGAKINICGGRNHSVRDVVLTGALGITGEYYPGATVIRPTVLRVTGPEIYVQKKSVIGLGLLASRFKFENYVSGDET